MRAVPSCLSPNAFALVRRNAAHVDEHADGLVELSGRAPQAEYLLGTSDAAGYGIDDREGILVEVRPASRGGSPRLSRRSVPAKLAGDGEKAIVAERNDADADVAIGGRGERGKSGPIHGRRISGSWSRQTFRHRPSVVIHGCLFRSTYCVGRRSHYRPPRAAARLRRAMRAIRLIVGHAIAYGLPGGSMARPVLPSRQALTCRKRIVGIRRPAKLSQVQRNASDFNALALPLQACPQCSSPRRRRYRRHH